MKRVLIIFFMLNTLAVLAQRALPTIQAACKVTTKNGKTYEGFVILINGDVGTIHPNGFYFYSDEVDNRIAFFNDDFKNLGNKNKTRNIFKYNGFDPKNVYFLVWHWDTSSYVQKEDKEIITDNSGQFLVTKTQIKRKYLILDTLPLITELTECMWVDYNNKFMNSYKILTKDIALFEIELEPSQKLLNEIDYKRKVCHGIVKTEGTGDAYQEPTWAHEIVKDTAQFEFLKEEFRAVFK